MSTAERPIPSLQVLLVEDEWLIAQQIEAALLGTRFEITGRAATLAEASHLADTRKFAVAILDGNLDGEDTSSLARRLAISGVRVLMVTACVGERSAPGAPAITTISKPFSHAGLVRALDRLISDQNRLDPTPSPRQS